MKPRQIDLILAKFREGYTTSRGISEVLNIPMENVSSCITMLVKHGFLQKIGTYHPKVGHCGVTNIYKPIANAPRKYGYAKTSNS